MEKKISDFIINELHGGDPGLAISPDDDLLSSGLLGSLQMMRLVDHLERETGHKVPPQDMIIDHFITVRAMADYFGNATAEAAK